MPESKPFPVPQVDYIVAGEPMLGRRIEGAVVLHIPSSFLSSPGAQANLLEWIKLCLLTRVPPHD